MPVAHVDCHVCACIIRGEEASCPFCGAPQVRAGAPVWLVAALVGGLGLAEVGCDEEGDPQTLRELSSTGDGAGTTAMGSTGGSTDAGSTGTSSTSETTTTGEDPNAEGSTYAGPDENTTSTSGATEPTTTGEPAPTTSGPMFPDSATYAGPDEDASVSDSLSETLSDTASDGGTSETEDTGDTGDTNIDEQHVDKDACACDSRERPARGLLGVLLLGVLRRRRRRA